MPRGLRRSEPQPPPVGSTVGSTTILPPVEVVSGEVVVPTHRGAGAQNTIAGNYRDEASPPKPSKPSGVHTVFDLTR